MVTWAPGALRSGPRWGRLSATMSDAEGPSPAPSTGDAASFEEAARRLSQIVAELEGGDLPLERSLLLFEEGVRIARAAQERLDQAERRVEELLGIDAQGKSIVRPFSG
jgi:exodeoxyribonuclease VII small subunit